MAPLGENLIVVQVSILSFAAGVTLKREMGGVRGIPLPPSFSIGYLSRLDSNSGNLATFTAMRRALSKVSTPAMLA